MVFPDGIHYNLGLVEMLPQFQQHVSLEFSHDIESLNTLDIESLNTLLSYYPLNSFSAFTTFFPWSSVRLNLCCPSPLKTTS